MNPSALQVGGDITVLKGSKFQVLFNMIDSVSNVVLPDPKYRVSNNRIYCLKFMIY